MRTLKLTDADYSALVFTLGYANGASLKMDGDIPEGQKELTDWILIQGPDSNYTYWYDKRTLRERKEAELAEEAQP